MSPPLPPPDLARRRPGLVGLPAGTSLHRLHSSAHGPVHFDRSRLGRFNAPDGRFGVLYAAATRAGAFAETFLRVLGRCLLPLDLVGAKACARFETTRSLALAHLGGPDLARIGATAEITHGGLPYDAPQRWSAALHDHPARLDGIAYTSRHDDAETVYALFDRAMDGLAVVERIADLDADWFWRIAERYDVGIAP